MNITARKEDLTIKGSTVEGKNVNLKAAGNVELEASENTNKSNQDSKSSGWNVGATIGLQGGIGVNAGANKGKDEIKENGTTYKQTEVTAQATLNVESGKDTNIIGSKASGETVKITAGENLNIESLKDKESYNEKNSSSGFNVSTELLKDKDQKKHWDKAKITGGANKGSINSNYESVTDQAGIYAGKGGFDVEVGKNTDLKGAVIASEADASKNKLSTGSLTYSDIQNKADYSASSVGVNYNSESKKYKDDPAKGFSPDMGMPSSGKASSQTKAGIANGTIIINGNQKQDLSNLNRDVKNLVNSLGKIFDEKSIQEKQEIAALFGKEASTLIGDIGEKAGWKDGGAEKIALHGLFGALSAKLGGGDALAGGIGAGFNELAMQEISNLKSPALREWAGFIVGASAARIFGHDAVTGGTTASWETRYNRDGHDSSDQSQIIQVIVYDSGPAGHAELRIGEKIYSFAAYNETDDSSGTMVEGRGVVKVYDNADARIISRLLTSNAYAYTLDVNDAEYWSIKNQFEDIVGSGNKVNVVRHANEPSFTAYQFNQDSPWYRYTAWGQNCTTFGGLNLYQGLKNGGGNPAEGLRTVAIPLQFRTIMQNWQSWSDMILYGQYLHKWSN